MDELVLIKSGFFESAEFFFYIMTSFAFFVGIMLIVSYRSFESFNASLQKEFGLKKRVAPKIEDTSNAFIDWIVSRYPLISGILISVIAFILLLVFKVA